MRNLIEKIEALVSEADADRDDAITMVLQPLVQQEFNKVQRRNRRLQEIRFGNGTFLIMVEDVESGGWNNNNCPKYAERLCDLCQISIDSNVVLNDVTPEITEEEKDRAEEIIEDFLRRYG